MNAAAGLPSGPVAPASSPRRWSPDRVPALPAAAALAGGIAVNRAVTPYFAWLLVLGLLCAIAVVCARSRPRIGAVCVLLLLACVGAIRHSQVAFSRPVDDISHVAIQDDAPVRLIGLVAGPIEIRKEQYASSTPTWMLMDRSTFIVDCEQLIGTRSLPVSGRIRVDVNGHVLGVDIGDRVELLGHLRIPAPPRDPDGFDLRAWLQSQGIDRMLSVEHPDAIRRLRDASSWLHRLARWRHHAREECASILAATLSDRTRAVGTSLLLGISSGMTDDLRDAFIHSGTMHLLAISGLHVSILALCVIVACRLLNVSPLTTTVIVVAGLWAYAMVTDLRPPVLRSAVLGTLMALAVPGARRFSGLNLLSATAFLMLLWSPGDLFDLGAQLSFLAVGAILWSVPIANRWNRRRSPLAPEQSRLETWLRKAGQFLAEGYGVTAAIWLFTLPLTLAWFEMISPVGFLINVLLVPFSTPLLVSGFATLVVGLIWPAAAIVPGFCYDVCLRVLLVAVEWAADTPWGHVSTAGPAPMWLATYYLLLIFALVATHRAGRRIAWRMLTLFVVGSLAWSLRPRPADRLDVTFIDVGHGGAVLFEFPDGQTALFDAGSFGRGRGATRSILRNLHSRRVTGLNSLILSHADADHYNAAADLIDEIPVAELFVSRKFVNLNYWGISDLCDRAARRNIPIRIIQAGDEFQIGDGATLRVLHPGGTFIDPLDNAHSIVLEANYAGRSVMVTADVERKGAAALMQAVPARRADVFQAPHHGSKASNIPDLARWAAPRIVVVSNRDDVVLPKLREVYASAERILTTAGQGTIRVHIPQSGDLQIQTTNR